MKINPRRLIKRLLQTFCLALLAGAPAAHAVDIVVLDDTFSDSTVRGSSASLTIQASTAKRAYLRFALIESSTVPTLANPDFQLDDSPLVAETTSDQIVKATLKVYINSITSGPVELLVKAITSDWDEASMKNGGTGTAALPTLGTTIFDAVKAVSSDNFITFDVTTLVKQWIGGSQPNFGLVLESANGTTGAFPGLNAAGSVVVSSKESTTATVTAIPASLTIQVGPAAVPKRGDVSMGIFTAGRQP